MKNFILVLLLMWTACANFSDDQFIEKKNSENRISSNGTFSKSQVKINRNGKTSASFESPGAMALMDEGHLSVELRSPDGRHSLIIQIENAQIGNFSITDMTEANKAVLLYLSEDLPSMLSPDSGSLIISEITKTQCSGSFSGSRKRENNHFELEGSFDKIPIKTL